MTPRQRLIVSVLFVVAVLATVGWFFATLMATPATAHCYSEWRYPQPQRCGVVRVAEGKPVPEPPSKPEEPLVTISKLNTIVLRPDPKRTDEEGRALAIEMLKAAMGPGPQ